jgi:hypothetical protein
MGLSYECPYFRTAAGTLHIHYCGVGQRSTEFERITLAELLTMLNDGYRTVPKCCGASPTTWVSVRWPGLFPWGWW